MITRNTKITAGFLLLWIGTFGGAAWKVAQTVALAEQSKEEIKDLKVEFRGMNDNVNKMTGDIGFIRGYFERIERKSNYGQK